MKIILPNGHNDNELTVLSGPLISNVFIAVATKHNAQPIE